MANQRDKEGKNIGIGWCDYTINLWWGCTEVHSGCDNCYARVLSNRWNNDLWGNDVPRKQIKSSFKNLETLQKEAAKEGVVKRVFIGSMMDIFEKPMDVMDSGGQNTGELRERLFNEIEFGYYPNLMFLLLTKRPSNINKYIPLEWKERPPSNVMFGTSPVDQETYDKLVGQLSEVKGHKFISMEPQLSEVSITKYSEHLSWVIQGGESGHHKRPFNLSWAYKTKMECEILNIPYFFKQIDKIQPIPEDLQIRQFPKI